ncbi:uncharacterized protein BYT42DRAFT_575890 [Radiomyces spectabilis]|uniref:uncharacterized protein n=1 Tax=Radiomyces spectabilis TaxID=64574 RepID=UPI0022201C1E|nr:uncharacterized protein BYT42DRAFT_575890 [Radiomyces spectabilis]KAI8374299.1 hypothetical protein BYT42DRAFT_575890 [Radiomyces spectabilis]
MADTRPFKRAKVEGTIHKRVPQRPATVPTDIYVSKTSKTTVLVNRIKRLMVNEKRPTVTLHGLGAMVVRAMGVALAAQEQMNHHVDLKPTTDTIKLIDDVIPEDMDEDLGTQVRMNSAIHIKIIAKSSLAELQQKAGPLPAHPSRKM